MTTLKQSRHWMTGLLLALFFLQLESCQNSSYSVRSAGASRADNLPPQGTLLAGGVGNGEGFEGRITKFDKFDLAQPCPPGGPLANSEIQLVNGKVGSTAFLTRQDCVNFDLPQRLRSQDVQLPTASNPNLIYQASEFSRATSSSPGLNSNAGANLFLYSEELDNPFWQGPGTAASPNLATAPDGSLTADLVRELAVNDQHNIGRNYSGPVNDSYSCSVFVRASGRTKGNLQVYEDSSSNLYNLRFDLADGSSSPGSSGASVLASSNIHAVGGGWYRVSVSGRLNPAKSASFPVCALYFSDPSGAAVYSGDGTSGMFAWGFQLEFGALVTPYFSATQLAAVP